MKRTDFYYDLPQELIAQDPLEQRDQSRMLVLDKNTGEMTHRHFYDIIDFLEEGDVLVLNDSKVMPARLYGVKEGTLGHMEISGRCWFVPGKKQKSAQGLSLEMDCSPRP